MIVIAGWGVARSQSAPATAAPPDIIAFLNQTISWYHQVAVQQQIAADSSEAALVADNSLIANQVVQQAFDFARIQAESKPSAGNATPGEVPDAARYQSLVQLATKLDQQVLDLKGEIESSRQKLDTTSGSKRAALRSLIAETQSEMELAEARRDAVRSLAQFAGGTRSNGFGATGLRAQIDAVARSLPGALTKPPSSEKSAAAAAVAEGPVTIAAPATVRKEPSGLWGLVTDLLAISRKSRILSDASQMTTALTEAGNQLRAPQVARLRELSERGDQLGQQAESADTTTHEQQKKELDKLTAQFKELSAEVTPLAKQSILLDLYQRNLAGWQNNIRGQSRAELRALLVRLGILAFILALLFSAAELARRATFRYVQDTRRRYQFLLMRRIVMWVLVAIIIAVSFANELSSVATFAGLLTAGVALALQSVILSIAGYFLLIGKFGIRVGDRVQISGVTGEVVEVGLVRLHLMELAGGSMTPTGRVVAFANSTVFQPAAGLFKQIPGTKFAWHEVTLTLPADSNYVSVEEHLMKAMKDIFAEYHEDLEGQRLQMERSLTSATVDELRPRSRVRFTSSGVELTIRFPVTWKQAAEIDNRVTRELAKIIEGEPRLKPDQAATPVVKLRTDVADPDAASH
jgi:small-conductance mechanosensitive channel